MKRLLLLLAFSVAAGGAQAKQHRRLSKATSDAENAAPASPGGANGAWTLDTATTVGNCPGLIPSTVQIVEGKIAATPEAGVSAWGYVDDSGTVVARFTLGGEGGRVARFHGTLRAGKGSGAWSSSTDMCGGTWRATRSGEATAAAAPTPAPAEQPADEAPALFPPLN